MKLREKKKRKKEKKEITLKNDRYLDVQNINNKKVMNMALLLIGMPIGSQLHILLQTCNDQRSKIHQKIWGKKRHEI